MSATAMPLDVYAVSLDGGVPRWCAELVVASGMQRLQIGPNVVEG